MAELKFTIDTEDLLPKGCNGEDCHITTLEKLIKENIEKEILEKVTSNINKKKINELSKKISEKCEAAIEKKLSNLINEDIVLSNRWGKPIFIGSVEDYIKQQIDDKILRPVDSNGRTLEGACQRENKTWLEYTIEERSKKIMEYLDDKLDSLERYEFKKMIDEKITEFKTSGINELIMARLKAAGVK